MNEWVSSTQLLKGSTQLCLMQISSSCGRACGNATTTCSRKQIPMMMASILLLGWEKKTLESGLTVAAAERCSGAALASARKHTSPNRFMNSHHFSSFPFCIYDECTVHAVVHTVVWCHWCYLSNMGPLCGGMLYCQWWESFIKPSNLLASKATRRSNNVFPTTSTHTN